MHIKPLRNIGVFLRGNYDNICISGTQKNNLNPVKWSTVTNSLDSGGLGITPLSATNFALLTNGYGDI